MSPPEVRYENPIDNEGNSGSIRSYCTQRT
jgi:hypothetical protein